MFVAQCIVKGIKGIGQFISNAKLSASAEGGALSVELCIKVYLK